MTSAGYCEFFEHIILYHLTHFFQVSGALQTLIYRAVWYNCLSMRGNEQIYDIVRFRPDRGRGSMSNNCCWPRRPDKIPDCHSGTSHMRNQVASEAKYTEWILPFPAICSELAAAWRRGLQLLQLPPTVR